MSFEPGSVVGDYQIIDSIGAGGMGCVYKVRNTISDRIEAMKVLLPTLTQEPVVADRFLREIKIQASLDHPHIAALHNAVRLDKQILMVMEYIEGRTLDQTLAAGRIPVQQGVEFIMEVLSALSYAHARGVVHRDVKPANIMVTSSGTVKLMDFGIAKIAADQNLTQDCTVGSLSYMSPEQVQGAEVGPQSDIYSTGVTLYEIVTGIRPFQGDSNFSIMSAHMTEKPVPPIERVTNIPQGLSEVILMAMAKTPEQRFKTADAFRNALRSVMQSSAKVGAPLATPAVPASSGTSVPVEPKVPAAGVGTPVAASVVASQAPPPVYTPPQPGQSNGGHRGLYMVLGSVVTIALLVAAAIELPKYLKSSANGSQTPVMSSPAATAKQNPAPTVVAPAPAEASQNATAAAPPPVSAPSVSAGKTSPAEAPQGLRPPGQSPMTSARAQQTPMARPVDAAPAQAAPATPMPAGPDPAVVKEVEALRDREGLMRPRIEGVLASLGRLSDQQAASGYGPSAELTAAASRMRSQMNRALAQLSAMHPAEAKQAMDAAERDLEKLEERFGR